MARQADKKAPFDRHVRLFLSTVTSEFGSYRDHLRRLLQRPNVTVHVQEDFVASGTDILRKLDDYIVQCDAVIHLAGDAPGAWAEPETVKKLRARRRDIGKRLPPLAPLLKSGGPPISYTQWEAYLALYHDKPLVVAVPTAAAPRDKPPDPSLRASQTAHLERLREMAQYAEISFSDQKAS